jgi:hypothetical protein
MMEGIGMGWTDPSGKRIESLVDVNGFALQMQVEHIGLCQLVWDRQTVDGPLPDGLVPLGTFVCMQVIEECPDCHQQHAYPVTEFTCSTPDEVLSMIFMLTTSFERQIIDAASAIVGPSMPC